MLSVLLMLFTLNANADTSKTSTDTIVYQWHFHDDLKQYQRFLPSPVPEKLTYHTRITTRANIDDTPNKEAVALIVVSEKTPPNYNSHSYFENVIQAYLLITDYDFWNPKKIDLFKLFDTGIHTLKAPAAKDLKLHSHSSIFSKKQKDSHNSQDVYFKLIDLTGDGKLDLWVECEHGVALISFQNGEFREVLSNYTISRQKLADAFEIEYYWYNAPMEPESQMYQRYLAAPPPKSLYYNTQMKAIANIDNTPEKEAVVLLAAETGTDGPGGEWVQAFILITDTEAEIPKKKDLFKLFDAGTHHFDVPAKTIEMRTSPFVIEDPWKGSPWGSYALSFKLVDLTGDGILDIWVECTYGAAVISFRNGEFKEVFSCFSYSRDGSPEYVDLDNDGIYEIYIPNRIFIGGIPGAAYPEWVSLYEWNGKKYILNNKKLYGNNNEIYKKLLIGYHNLKTAPYGKGVHVLEVYEFYLGLAHYYRGKPSMAQSYLQRVAEKAENEDYIKAAESILKKLPKQRK